MEYQSSRRAGDIKSRGIFAVSWKVVANIIADVTLPRVFRDVIDFVYPGRCAGCDGDCDGYAFLCHGCEAGLDNLAAQSACERCALPVVSRGAPCPWCRGRGVHPFEKIVRLGRFDDPLRNVIHAMKYQRRWPLAEHLAERLLAESAVKTLLSETDVLVPVPLHWSRQIGRGYNQADVLATALARQCGLKVLRPVRRVRRTASQTTIGARTVREENVHGAFSAKACRVIAGKRVVVVDDVMTTAATLQAVGRALKPLEPAEMSAIVVAVADPKGHDFLGV
jgi:ComF family protein